MYIYIYIGISAFMLLLIYTRRERRAIQMNNIITRPYNIVIANIMNGGKNTIIIAY